MGNMRRFWIFLLLIAGLTGCRPATPAPPLDVDRVRAAAAATLTALPSPTPCPTQAPLPTPSPPPTPDIRNLYCEYGFCLEHPGGAYYFDALVLRETHRPSDAAYGLLVSYQPNFYMQIGWATLVGEADPYSTLALLTEKDILDLDSLNVEQIAGLIVTSAPLLKTASPDVLPYGLAATWVCGQREFSWKVYAASENQPEDLLRLTLSRFQCAP